MSASCRTVARQWAGHLRRQPISRRVQDVVYPRFDRARCDAARRLDAFADCVRDEVDLRRCALDLIGAVHETTAPATISLWLCEERVSTG